MARPPAGAPWAPAKYNLPDVTAIQFLARGEASKAQQVRALKWIVNEVAGTYEPSYRSGNEHDTSFAEGKRYVGLSIVKMTKLNPQLLKEK